MSEKLPNSQIAKALLEAQREIESAAKDSTNPHYKSKYADLSNVIDAVKPALNKNGIVFVQAPAPPPFEGYLAITTLLLHESGESISGTAVVPLSKNDPQAYGSAMTYARRYSLASIVGLKTEDDDGEGAVDHAKTDGGLTRPKQGFPAKAGFKPFGPGEGERQTQAPAPQRKKTGLFPVPKTKAPKSQEGGGDDGEDAQA